MDGTIVADEVRRQVVDDNVDAAVAEFESTHGLVGDDLHEQPGVCRRAAVVILEPIEQHVVVRHEPHETVRTGADRRTRHLRASAIGHDAHTAQVRRERRGRGVEHEPHAVRVDRLDRHDIRVRTFPAGQELRIEETPVCVDDIRRGQQASVVEPHPCGQRDDVLAPVEGFDRRREVGHHAQVVVDTCQRVEDELVNALGGFIEPDAGIEVQRRVPDADDQVRRRNR
jgi:hypothetical protein